MQRRQPGPGQLPDRRKQMAIPRRWEELHDTLIRVLRHLAERLGIRISPNGWVWVKELQVKIKQMEEVSTALPGIDKQILRYPGDNSPYQRLTFRHSGGQHYDVIPNTWILSQGGRAQDERLMQIEQLQIGKVMLARVINPKVMAFDIGIRVAALPQTCVSAWTAMNISIEQLTMTCLCMQSLDLTFASAKL